MDTAIPFLLIGIGFFSFLFGVGAFIVQFFVLYASEWTKWNIAIPLIGILSGIVMVPVGVLIGGYQAVSFIAKLVG